MTIDEIITEAKRLCAMEWPRPVALMADLMPALLDEIERLRAIVNVAIIFANTPVGANRWEVLLGLEVAVHEYEAAEAAKGGQS